MKQLLPALHHHFITTRHPSCMTPETETASPTLPRAGLPGDNPLAPTHSRPAQPHKKQPSRRALKKRQGRSGAAPATDAPHTEAATRRGAPRNGREAGVSSTALLMPLAGIVALACVFRMMR